MGVDGGYIGELAARVNNGSTRAFHGPWNGFPSTNSVSNPGRMQSQLGSECILFLRRLNVCSFSRAMRGGGSVLMPVASAIRTRRDVRLQRNTGSARRGFDAMFNSSRFPQSPSAGERAPRKFAETSRAKRVSQMFGRVFARNEGTELGVDADPSRRCVVPVRDR